jgi:glycosyltransferase involved in cell wall biosynthesis
LDRVAHNLIPLYLNAGNVLLLCSNHEGSPNIVKEALACNRPVVSTDVGDVRERFYAVKGLFLVPPYPNSIAEAVSKAMRMGKSNGREFVTNLSEEAVAKQLFLLYQSILHKCNGKYAETALISNLNYKSVF